MNEINANINEKDTLNFYVEESVTYIELTARQLAKLFYGMKTDIVVDFAMMFDRNVKRNGLISYSKIESWYGMTKLNPFDLECELLVLGYYGGYNLYSNSFDLSPSAYKEETLDQIECYIQYFLEGESCGETVLVELKNKKTNKKTDEKDMDIITLINLILK